ncbi:MAG: pilus assembly protein PilM [Gammaproteobacteria bacterium]
MALQQLMTRLRRPLSRSKMGVIGIDLSLQHLHMVQFKKCGDGSLELHAQVSISYPGSREELLSSPEALKKVLSRAFSGGKFDGRSVVLGMPGGRFRTVSVNYKLHGHESDDQVIARMMAERLDGDVSDYVMDYIPVRAEARDAEKLAIVALSKRNDVTAFLDSMAKAGLDVKALEISPVAIRRLAATLPGAKSDLVLILNTGVKKSYLTMLSGRRLLMDQSVEFSESRMLATVANTLDISEESALRMLQRTGLHPASDELSRDHREGETGICNTLLEILKPEFQKLVEETDRAFMYASAQARGGGDARILLFGSLARLRGADHVLSRLTRLPVTILPNPLQSFGEIENGERSGDAVSEPEFAFATGLALRGLVDDE